MESESSLQCSQELSTGLYHKPHHHILSEIHFNIIPHVCLRVPCGLFPSYFGNKQLYFFKKKVKPSQYYLCGLVVRVPGYRSRGPCSIPGATRFSDK
jgi:hypothetical protein